MSGTQSLCRYCFSPSPDRLSLDMLQPHGHNSYWGAGHLVRIQGGGTETGGGNEWSYDNPFCQESKVLPSFLPPRNCRLHFRGNMNYPKLWGRLRKINISWLKEKGSNGKCWVSVHSICLAHVKLHLVAITSQRDLILASHFVPYCVATRSFCITVFQFGACLDKFHHAALADPEFSCTSG